MEYLQGLNLYEWMEEFLAQEELSRNETKEDEA